MSQTIPLVCIWIVLLSASLALSQNPYPIQKGAKWTYVTESGNQKTSEVKDIRSFLVEGMKIFAAAFERTDGELRWLLRSKNVWMECGPADLTASNFHCPFPMILFQWPLSPTTQWKTANLSFFVQDQESLQVLAQTYPNAWKILYGASANSQPLGQLWFVEGVGPVRFQEQDQELNLVRYSPGKGEMLPITEEKFLEKLMEKKEKQEAPSKPVSSLKSWSFPGIAIQDAFFAMVGIFLVVVIWMIRAWTKASKETPADPVLSFSVDPTQQANLSLALGLAGDLASCRKKLEELVQERPDYPDLRLHLAHVLRACGDFEEAKKNLEKALQANRKYTKARLELGRLLLAMKRPQEALPELQRVLEENPDFPDVLMDLGRTFLALGEKERARTSLQKALEINPSLDLVRELLSQC